MSTHRQTSDYDALETEAKPDAQARREPTALPTGQHANADVTVSSEGNLGFNDFAGHNVDDGPEGSRAYREDGPLAGTEDEADASESMDPDDSAVSGQQLASRKAGISGKGAGLAGMPGIKTDHPESYGLTKGAQNVSGTTKNDDEV